MAKVKLSNTAIKDLESVYLYISVDSELYAENIINKIFARFKVLETHIRIGKIVPEFGNPMIRELIEGSYRIIYKIISEEDISIARIYHSSRLLKKI